MKKDVIIFWNNENFGHVVLNGNEVDYEFDYPIDVGYLLMRLFNDFNLNKDKLIVTDFYEEDVFTDNELELFYNRLNATDEFFTQEELDVLRNTQNKDLFLDKVRVNL